MNKSTREIIFEQDSAILEIDSELNTLYLQRKFVKYDTPEYDTMKSRELALLRRKHCAKTKIENLREGNGTHGIAPVMEINSVRI